MDGCRVKTVVLYNGFEGQLIVGKIIFFPRLLLNNKIMVSRKFTN